MKTKQDLEAFHAEMMEGIQKVKIPSELKALCNSEFRGYLDGEEYSRYYFWLAKAVRKLQPEIIIELGTNVGASAIAMFSGIEGPTQLLTVDILDVARFIPDSMRNANNFHSIIGDDLNSNLIHKYNPALFEYIFGRVDFLFIDTDHWAKQLRSEWEIYSRFLAPGAMVVLDDLNVNDMRTVWDDLPYPKLDISADCHHSGFGVFIYTP